jgi:2-keto-4-pentenoate hydratase
VAHRDHSLAGGTQPAVEPELLLEADEDGGVARMGVALEVVDFDRPLEDLEDVIAHNVFHRAVALGELGPVVPDPGEAIFTINGEERARVAEFEPPADTLAFVAGFLERCGQRLAPGDLVIAGALAPAAPVAHDDVAELDVGRVGAISLRFGSM